FGLNTPHIRQGPVQVPGLRPVGVEDIQKVEFLPPELGGKPGQNPGADGIAAYIQDAGPARILKNRQNLRIQGGNVRHAAAGGDDHPDSGSLQPPGLLIGAEIGVYNVQIRQSGLPARACQLQGQIHGVLRLTAAVVTGDNLYAFQYSRTSSWPFRTRMAPWARESISSSPG